MEVKEVILDLQYFGGRGASSSGSGGDINTSNRIKNQIIQKGLNSKFAGVRRDAENGKGRTSETGCL